MARKYSWSRCCAAAVAIGAFFVAGAVRADKTVTYYYTDPAGTVLMTADSHGLPLVPAEHSPYGRHVIGEPDGAIGFDGHIEDEESGFVYMQARYYDALVGRFISVDQSDADEGAYAFAQDNPLTRFDPDGNSSATPDSDRDPPAPRCDAECHRERQRLEQAHNNQPYTGGQPGSVNVKTAAGSPYRPILSALIQRPIVRNALAGIWKASKPYGPGSGKMENGFFVVVKPNAGLQIVYMQHGGASRSQLMPGKPPADAILFAHDHPNTIAEGYLEAPSPADVNYANFYNIPGVVVTHGGVYFFGPAIQMKAGWSHP